MSFTIDEMVPPGSLEGSAGEHFRAYVGIRNAVEAEVVGSDVLTPTADELLPEFRSNPTRKRSHATVSVDGVAVGRAMVTTRPHSPGAGAYLVVDVLSEHRGKGIGSALHDWARAAALAEGETVLKVSIAHTVSTPGERIESPTGFGDVPARDPGVRFLVRLGYVLEQVARISVLDTAGLADRLRTLSSEAQAVAGDGYRLVSWAGPTPPEWLDDLAVLHTRMSTDAPMAGLQAQPDPWDAHRVAAHDARIAEGGQTVLTTAAEHVASGRLVGFSEIYVPDGRHAAMQEDTLVLREHRGQRLGMLLKAATASELLRVAPHVRTVITYNAEENRPMLDVNEAMGFRPIGYEGGWQKK
ncbi:MAG: GNAT family N-acetyltransferase [Aeromicrobium sp.]